MCGGGGNAAAAAQQQEAQREATISGNVKDINSAFGNRTAQYTDYAKALQGQYETELNRQQTIAARNQKFSLARGGLTGGSSAVDQGALLGQETASGTLKAQQQVGSAVAGLQSKDEATREQMISLAQSGGDIGNGATQTANALQANIGNAQAQNVEQGLGDVFGGVTQNINAAQQAAALRSGIYAGTARASLYGGGIGATPAPVASASNGGLG
jgi:hypothetical protein